MNDTLDLLLFAVIPVGLIITGLVLRIQLARAEARLARLRAEQEARGF